jgi:hypothetical protein
MPVRGARLAVLAVCLALAAPLDAPPVAAAAPVQGPVVAWGYNGQHQTGVPSGLSDAIAIDGGGGSSVALRANGVPVAWGDDTTLTTIPAEAANLTAVSLGAGHILGLKADGTVIAWGGNNFWGQRTVPPGLTGVVAVEAGNDFSLALKSNGTIVGWGDNFYGESTSALTDAIAISAGTDFSMALRANGTVVVWGYQALGYKQPPAGLDHVIAIAAGYTQCLALKDDGTVVAWGDSSSGLSNVPPGITDAIGIAAGAYTNYLLRATGEVVAWGSDQYRQVTDAPSTGAVVLAAGNGHGLAITVPTQDTTAPTVAAKSIVLRSGTALSGTALAVSLSWSGADETGGSGISHYEVQRRVNGGTWANVSTTATGPALATTVASTGTTEFRVTAVDKAGNRSTPSDWAILRPALVQQRSSAIVYRGTWRTASSSRFSGGSVRYATRSGASAKYTFTGRGIALVTTKSSSRGKVKIYIDGATTPTATVDLRSATTRYRVQVWVKSWAVNGRHTIRIVCAGTAGRPRIDLDAFAVLK